MRLVVQVGKVEAEGFRLLLEPGGIVGGMGYGIVAADGDEAERLACVVPAQRRQALLDVLDVRAVGADE